MKVIDLGWCMARLEIKKHSAKLIIVSPSATEDNAYSPAETVVIYGEVNVLALRDALNEEYPTEVLDENP